jgi:hypothetical protein
VLLCGQLSLARSAGQATLLQMTAIRLSLLQCRQNLSEARSGTVFISGASLFVFAHPKLDRGSDFSGRMTARLFHAIDLWFFSIATFDDSDPVIHDALPNYGTTTKLIGFVSINAPSQQSSRRRSVSVYLPGGSDSYHPSS